LAFITCIVESPVSHPTIKIIAKIMKKLISTFNLFLLIGFLYRKSNYHPTNKKPHNVGLLLKSFG